MAGSIDSALPHAIASAGSGLEPQRSGWAPSLGLAEARRRLRGFVAGSAFATALPAVGRPAFGFSRAVVGRA